jgi:hypothetical protein
MTVFAYLDNAGHPNYGYMLSAWLLLLSGGSIYSLTSPDILVYPDSIVLKTGGYTKQVPISSVSNVKTYPFYTVVSIKGTNVLLRFVGLLATGAFTEYFTLSRSSHSNYEMLITYLNQNT